jgi:hypothetical protein
MRLWIVVAVVAVQKNLWLMASRALMTSVGAMEMHWSLAGPGVTAVIG